MGMNFKLAPSERDGAGMFGAVDAFDPQSGLTGWCVDIADAAAECEVELVVNGAAVASARAAHARRDVCEAIGIQGRFGFCFDASVFDAFLLNRPVFAAKEFSVRIAGQGWTLPSHDGLPTLGALLEAREAWLKRSEGQALLESLEIARQGAGDMLFQPPRKTAADADGVIEAIAFGAGNVLWFLGWTSSRGAAEFPAVVLDRRKYAAGLRCAYFRRADLAEPAVGIVGALLTDWRPSASSDALVAFGENGENVLRALRPLRVTTPGEVFGHLRSQDEPYSRALARAMLAIAAETDGWALETPASKKIKLAVDAAQFIEGFGVFMKGWVVSPSHRVTGMALKLGEEVLEAAPSSLHFAPRPDLTAGFPRMGAAIERAGFTIVFRGDLRDADFCAATLRLTYENSASTHHRLDDVQIVRLSPADLAGLRDFYPVLEREAFFKPLALAVHETCARDYGRVMGDIVTPCAHALIFCAPSERRLQFLLFEHLRARLAGCRAQGVGVVIVAPESSRHGEIGELFAEFAENFAGAASLVFVADVDCALWSLDAALSLVDARRFVFVGPDVALADAGWAALDRLVGAGDDLTFFDASDPDQPWLPARIGSAAFSWSSQAWRRFLRDQNRRLPLRSAVDAEVFPEARRIAAGAEVLRRTAPPPRLIEHVNRVLALGAQS
ncbi:hypothetical protein M2323_001278 [Rhodoblastus acidophilus]|uniref:hypothetical protein n=1 Tax=Rhodoblastus acidophilus TaxID=1074 RepID=UPI002224A5FB|nr:hypothetical protein [Rhodoblastus acidophilus]MCW2283506.1 hypothetical protein [Rhodoblastus acidophilus]MCW2332366.1 hypothetical protein [Rhodoblastus acidophilus]